MSFLATAARYDRNGLLVRVRSLRWDKGWRPGGIVLHNTGSPNLRQAQARPAENLIIAELAKLGALPADSTAASLGLPAIASSSNTRAAYPPAHFLPEPGVPMTMNTVLQWGRSRHRRRPGHYLGRLDQSRPNALPNGQRAGANPARRVQGAPRGHEQGACANGRRTTAAPPRPRSRAYRTQASA